MATNLAIDDKLILKAQKISGLKTKKETVSTALKEFIQRRKQKEILQLFMELTIIKNIGQNSESIGRYLHLVISITEK